MAKAVYCKRLPTGTECVAKAVSLFPPIRQVFHKFRFNDFVAVAFVCKSSFFFPKLCSRRVHCPVLTSSVIEKCQITQEQEENELVMECGGHAHGIAV